MGLKAKLKERHCVNIVAISVTNITRKNTSKNIETSPCGLVSKPIGGGNSRTVRIKIAITAPIAPFLANLRFIFPLFIGILFSILLNYYKKGSFEETQQSFEKHHPAFRGGW
jgi:hypothetical protein